MNPEAYFPLPHPYSIIDVLVLSFSSGVIEQILKSTSFTHAQELVADFDSSNLGHLLLNVASLENILWRWDLFMSAASSITFLLAFDKPFESTDVLNLMILAVLLNYLMKFLELVLLMSSPIKLMSFKLTKLIENFLLSVLFSSLCSKWWVFKYWGLPLSLQSLSIGSIIGQSKASTSFFVSVFLLLPLQKSMLLNLFILSLVILCFLELVESSKGVSNEEDFLLLKMLSVLDTSMEVSILLLFFCDRSKEQLFFQSESKVND